MGDDNYVHQLLWSETDNVWHYNDLTSASLGSPKAASNSGVAAFVDTYHGTQNVYYVSDTRDIIELRWMPF